jgi:hypothetical protein
MRHTIPVAALLCSAVVFPPPACAADDAELQQLRQEIDSLRHDYEARMRALEARLQQMQAPPPAAAAPAAPPAATAATNAPPAAPDSTATAAASSGAANGFNPALSLILSGNYAHLSRDPAGYAIAGFLPGGDIGPGRRGFSLGESELGIAANIDPWFYGAFNLALHADDAASVEEAYVQTTALPASLTLRAGRFFSGIGYLNEQHAHTWDFVDAPLAYQAFLGGQLAQDGLQLRALLPTERFVELGAELAQGNRFPAGGDDRNRPGSAALFAHTGGDIGASQSWRAGVSLLWSRPEERASDGLDAAGQGITNLFSGTGRLWVADAVWKWAPNGNPQRTNLKLQGEYFRRRESGSLVFDSTGAASSDRYASTQSGGYAQAVYQFMPTWRAGLRYDRLDVGSVDAGANAVAFALPDFTPARVAAMLDWSPSEFSRVRLQLARERTRFGESDNQVFLQYQMSLGAHGAHSF